MRLGDLLELIAAACLIAAGAFYSDTRIALACIAGFICLFYLAQCHDATPLPRRHKSD